MRDFGDRHRRQRADRVIHLAQEEDVEVAHVPRHEQRDHLTAAILEGLVAAGPAVEDDDRVARLLALPDDVLPRRDAAHPLARRPRQEALVLGRKPGEAFELADEEIVHASTRVGGAFFPHRDGYGRLHEHSPNVSEWRPGLAETAGPPCKGRAIGLGKPFGTWPMVGAFQPSGCLCDAAGSLLILTPRWPEPLRRRGRRGHTVSRGWYPCRFSFATTTSIRPSAS